MTKFGNVEPSAGTRELARATREVFVALVHEGFTEPQALVIIGQMIAAGIASKKRDGEG